MLDYNTAFYNKNTKYWYWDEVNSQAATCYIKFSEQYYDYIQLLRPHKISFVPIKDNEVIIPIAKVFPTAEILEGIVKYIIPLYTHVIFKVNSIVKIHPTSQETKLDEFQIKTVPRLELPMLRMGKFVITDQVGFSLTKKKQFMSISLECTVNVCL